MNNLLFFICVEFSVRKMNELLKENLSMVSNINKMKDVIRDLWKDQNKVFQQFGVKSPTEYQKFMKKARKIKELNKDNGKLRQLLKVHIENSEKLRIETQTTVETLREEFDLLVQVNSLK